MNQSIGKFDDDDDARRKVFRGNPSNIFKDISVWKWWTTDSMAKNNCFYWIVPLNETKRKL